MRQILLLGAAAGKVIETEESSAPLIVRVQIANTEDEGNVYMKYRLAGVQATEAVYIPDQMSMCEALQRLAGLR